ncbi:MAG: hypothetical protein P8I99_04145 [Acidimicrobiales bacterium]|nr:hypothetical protein [Acidimicrobiales bacterium]MDG1876593.1 hypothetical protein [Acidimicrobiales bacterium]
MASEWLEKFEHAVVVGIFAAERSADHAGDVQVANWDDVGVTTGGVDKVFDPVGLAGCDTDHPSPGAIDAGPVEVVVGRAQHAVGLRERRNRRKLNRPLAVAQSQTLSARLCMGGDNPLADRCDAKRFIPVASRPEPHGIELAGEASDERMCRLELIGGVVVGIEELRELGERAQSVPDPRDSARIVPSVDGRNATDTGP